MKPEDVLNFWFKEISSQQQFGSDPEFDHIIRERFLKIFELIMQGGWSKHRRTAEGRLAEIIVLDQFSRNMFRNQSEAFSADSLALRLAKEAVAAGADQELSVSEKAFLYMPYMHSEEKQDHEVAVKLFSQPGLENNLKFEYLHKKIIDRFGRYPHRNQILGRTSTPEEVEFLKEKNSSF